MDSVNSIQSPFTVLPPSFLSEISDTLKEAHFESHPGEFICEGRVFDKEFVVRLGFCQTGALLQNNMEVSLQFQDQTKSSEKLYKALDIAYRYFLEFGFKERSDLIDLPRSWVRVEEEDSSDICHFRYSEINTRLEAEADRLLSEFADSATSEGAYADRALVRTPGSVAAEDALNVSFQAGSAEELSEIVRSFRKLNGQDAHH